MKDLPVSDPVAILTDTTLCVGCEKCVVACKEENKLGKDRMWPWQKSIDELSATRFTTLIKRPGGRYIRHQCRHCLDPACVSACIVGALRKTPEGAVVYDQDKCMGCRYCMLACPFGIPRYDWERAISYIHKCTLCDHRLAKGKIPACVEACPEKATIFGPRSKMLAEARRRLRDNPGKYVQRIYGEREVGGTSVLYISDIPLDFLAWQDQQGKQPLPELTWAVQKNIPPVAAGGFGLLGGVYWIIGRRMRTAGRGGTLGPAKPAAGMKTFLWAPIGVLLAVAVARLGGGLEGIHTATEGAAWVLWLACIIVTGIGLGGAVSWITENWAGGEAKKRSSAEKGGKDSHDAEKD
ncbi:4Fe-4S dicluster domain-containing protein [Elusimicrobiota bacterium]